MTKIQQIRNICWWLGSLSLYSWMMDSVKLCIKSFEFHCIVLDLTLQTNDPNDHSLLHAVLCIITNSEFFLKFIVFIFIACSLLDAGQTGVTINRHENVTDQ